MKTFTTFSDQELIHLYITGEVDALSSLVQRHKDKIYTSIYLMVKDHYLAEDIFQDTFIKIIDSINNKKYTEDGKFLPWALRIAHNLCVDHFRKLKRIPTIKTNCDHDIFEILNFSEPGFEEKMIQHQSHDRVRKLLEGLPDDQREVIIMRHYADLSFKEIAQLTNCSINTALGRMRYGLFNLRKMMTERQMAF